MTVSTKALEHAAENNGSYTINPGLYSERRIVFCERPRDGREDTVPAVDEVGGLYWVTVDGDGNVTDAQEARGLNYDDIERFIIPETETA